ncbi:hypothetical protein D3C86_1930360 [compost metagenome]
MIINEYPFSIPVSTTAFKHASTVSAALIAALKIPVCPTISVFAKFRQIKSGHLLCNSGIMASLISLALISGFKS